MNEVLNFPHMNELKISRTLFFPLDAATQTFAFIGRKGSGKTYGSGKLVELLIGAGVQVMILDSVGNWYGLRLAADGKSAGIDIPILGGLRGDIPLEATGGALIADTLVESGRSMIIDASQFSKADRQRFAAALGERLWRRKKAEIQPTPIHLVLEESQLIVPERVQADDPRELRKEIAELRRQLAQKPAVSIPEIKEVKIPAVTIDQIERLTGLTAHISQIHEKLTSAIPEIAEVAHGIADGLSKIGQQAVALRGAPTKRPALSIQKMRPSSQPQTHKTAADSEVGTGGLRRMLIALAQRPQGMSAQQLGVRAGLSSKSGSFGTYLGRARSNGWLEGSRDHLLITEKGLSALGDWDPLPTGDALLDYWLRDLGTSGAARMLRALADIYPHSLSRQELAERSGMTGNSGSFGTYLGRLRSLELISGSGDLRTSAELFD